MFTRNREDIAKRITLLMVTVLLLSAIVCVLSLPECAAANSSLTVTVRNQLTSSPIVGANVSISGPVNQLQVTGASGIVVFSNIPAGSYQILTSAKEYPNIVSHTIQVGGDTNIIVLFSYTKAYFTYSPYPVYANKTVTFDASLSNSTGDLVNYGWDFGDNTTGTGVTPVHKFTHIGSYTVLLTVTSTVGTATYSRIVTVTEENPGPIPYLWLILIIPFFFLIPFLFYRRRRYCVVIQARISPTPCHLHCPGDGTNCDGCKVTPC
jgi:PKD repeat protein